MALNRSFPRTAVLTTWAASAVALVAACGLQITGLAKPEEGALPGEAGGPSLPDGAPAEDPDAGPQQQECIGEKTTCPSGCTDLKTDPQNCGLCGKACPPGENCTDGNCQVLCLGETTACSNVCVNTETDPAHCGTCPVACDAGLPFCAGGLCVPDCGGLKSCPVAAPTYCADTQTDPKNCGECGTTCKSNEACKAGVCTSLCAGNTPVGDVFATNMVGCVGTVRWSQRATLCPAGAHVCTPDEWVARYGAKKPTYNYWTSVNLGYEGGDRSCSVDDEAKYGWVACNNPMRVCTNYTDPLGNRCNWKECGFKTRTNRWFGGCDNNNTAGTLCCTN